MDKPAEPGANGGIANRVSSHGERPVIKGLLRALLGAILDIVHRGSSIHVE